jgi:cytidyltransferase-like protein
LKEKRVLGAVLALRLTLAKATRKAIAARLGEDEAELARTVSSLRARGLLEGRNSDLRLTAEGRARLKVIFIGGGFEVIHPGHLHTILQAKRLGDVLVVVVARDSTIRRRKQREPISNEQERLELISSLRPVDAATLGVEGNIYETLERVGPDIVALGYDQYHQEAEIQREAERRGMKLRVVRLTRADTDVKTSKLIAELS